MSNTDADDYQSGFGNEFASEALPGALPRGQNSPQRCPYSLYAEQLSGTAFTAPRHANRRSWLYRIRPSVTHGTFRSLQRDAFAEQAVEAPLAPTQLRWDPMPLPTAATDFVEGLVPVAGNGSPDSHSGCGIYLYAANQSMRDRYFYSADGEWLIVPQLGALTLDTELGRMAIEPQEIAVIPRGLRFRVGVPGDAARGYICENFGAPFKLPDLGPIGSNGLANPRDFSTPRARYEDIDRRGELIAKFQGRLWVAEMDHSPLDVVAWHGNNVPYKYDLRRFNVIGSISYDHPDPSIFLVLHSPSDTPGTSNVDFVVFPPRWLAMQDTFRPPWFHRNVASEYLGLIAGQYDAKSTGFVAGGASLHNCMSAHGPDAATFEKATAADTSRPVHVTDTMAFMFESRMVIKPTRQALEGRPPLQKDYLECWSGLRKLFDPESTVSGRMAPDATNNPLCRSWVATANHGEADFPIQNLPIAEFRRRDSSEAFRGGIAIGDQVLDLAALATAGAFSGESALALRAAARSTLNDLMQMGPRSWSALRRALFEALLEGSVLRPMLEPCLVPLPAAEYSLPAHIGDFTDFYSSVHHATAVGRLFRPDNPLTPNYKWMPIGYHGRSSSIGISGQDFHRPRGQRLPPGESRPMFAPSVRLDYELELGVFLGDGNSIGSSIPIDSAESHVFGLCLLNDWSARDLQAWEYQPLGPFLSKNFATTVSPWIVSLQALAPYRTAHIRGADDPQPPDYLVSSANEAAGGVDITLEAYIETAAMHAHREPPQRLSSSSFRHAYWTLAQLISHHTVNGCNLRAGDLLGTGTQSGPGPGEAGSLLELSSGGKHSIRVGSSEHRTFLEDGDTVIFRAWCARPGAARVGFGEVRGRVLSAAD